MYDIMVYEEALYVPHFEEFDSYRRIVVKLCGVLVLVNCDFIYISRMCI